MNIDAMLKDVEKSVGVPFIGLLRKSARIKGRSGSELSDIQGWDVVLKEKSGGCYEYYVAQPPLIGMTQPEPIECPLGIVAFDSYKIDIEEAIKIFKSQNGGDQFVSISLCWPLVHPAATEPHWYFRTNLGNEVVIGANSGQTGNISGITVLYMAKSE